MTAMNGFESTPRSSSNSRILSDPKSADHDDEQLNSMKLKIRELEAEVQRLNALRLNVSTASTQPIASNVSNVSSASKSIVLQQQNQALQSNVATLTVQKKSRMALQSNKEMWCKKRENLRFEIENLKVKKQSIEQRVDDVVTAREALESDNVRLRAEVRELKGRIKGYDAHSKMETDKLTKEFMTKIHEISSKNEGDKVLNEQLILKWNNWRYAMMC